MGTVRNEYHRFLVSLKDQEASDDVCRIGRVIWDHLDVVATTSATRRQRSRTLQPLLKALDQCLPDVPASFAQATNQRFSRVQGLVVGPFRGFMASETFDFSKDITLVYGANGTGKSSLCAALELALLRSVSEAQASRLDQRRFCDNARLGRHVFPELTVLDVQGQPIAVTADEEAYRFCFVEKNRIEGFARIAARSPADQRELIATLFGVDEFNNFVRGFNPDLDEEFPEEGPKHAELQRMRQQLTQAEQLIASADAKETQWRERETAWAAQVLPGHSFEVARTWLYGNEEQKGRLATVVEQLDTPLPALRNLRRIVFEEQLSTWLEAKSQLEMSSAMLVTRSTEVLYRQLYQAVYELANAHTGVCPACETPLDRVVTDPYARASHGLETLAELAALQERRTREQATVDRAALDLLGMMRRVRDAELEMEGVWDAVELPELPEQATGDWLAPWMANDHSAWNALLAFVEDIERRDGETRRLQRERAPLIEERTKLESFDRGFVETRTLRDDWARSLNTARQLVRQFDEDNRELIDAAAAEAPVTAMGRRAADAYVEFLVRLKTFMDALPGQLLLGLGARTVDLYNRFNRDDPVGDKLHALHLPVAPDRSIELEYVSDPGRRFNALQILSEGHIRCLGLAILLAKNVESNCPLCVFDDAVNAIDDEHRNGIWRTLFEDRVLGDAQIILTSHAQEFLDRIQQELGIRRVRDDVRCYKFLPRINGQQLNVDADPPNKNYALRAQENFDQDNFRDALSYSRKALESLTDQLWTWLGRRGDGRIELKLAGPRAPWELNNKCAKLKKALDGRTEPPAVQAAGALQALVGINGGSIEWSYLNGGTHDSQRDHEFDRSTIRTIVQSILTLDSTMASLRAN